MPDKENDGPIEEFEAWKQQAEAGEVSPQETFKKISNIAVLMGYDLIDKLRFYEKETLALPEDQIVDRVEHMTRLVDQLRVAYLGFAELDK